VKHALTVLNAAKAAARYSRTNSVNNCNGGRMEEWQGELKLKDLLCDDAWLYILPLRFACAIYLSRLLLLKVSLSVWTKTFILIVLSFIKIGVSICNFKTC